MKYNVCWMIPVTMDIYADNDQELDELISELTPYEYAGDSIYIECEDGRCWEE